MVYGFLLQVEVIIKAVKKLIQEQVKAIREQNCSVSLYPQSIMELVFSEVIFIVTT